MKILLCISYLGSSYHGWQVQQNSCTVQQTVQDAIERITGTRSDLTGCSRTDAGVHANNYYCCFSLDKEFDTYKLVKALNAVLPYDISVKSAQIVADSFHPRYSAKGKEYIYRIYNGAVRNPFEQNRAYCYQYRLDAFKMNKAAKHLLGEHNFASFCASGSSVKDMTRTIYNIDVAREADVVNVTISANGFLYNMVRIIVGTLIDVSNDKIDSDAIVDIIAAQNRKDAGFTAPPEGLYLNRVFY